MRHLNFIRLLPDDVYLTEMLHLQWWEIIILNFFIKIKQQGVNFYFQSSPQTLLTLFRPAVTE